ncbi:uncharacterized protein LOC130934895 [Arachis stenosperma]|uniref:uncharacterized protein LOC130934895 n=1 Tax=Arachis stenosperma TaxID=217475 RepID=UPI0025AC6955|nr:uncharacterized protein LOC130934895 [Arachis stenosperma]
MAKKNAQEAYQRVREAKAKSRARSGVVISPPPPPPPPKNTGTPTQPIVLSSSSLPRPPPSAQILSEPEKKKRKTSESGSSSFDGGVVIDGAIVDPPVPEVISESDLKTRGQRIIESPPRPTDASGSSSVPPPGPGGVPPGGVPPGGGDSSILSKK